MINEGKTKYMILLRKNYNQQSLAMNRMFFERANTFKYLEMKLRADGDNHREFQQRINSANRYFFALKPVLSSKFPLKQKLYCTN